MSDPDDRISGAGSEMRLTVAMQYAAFEQACLHAWPGKWRREARFCFFAGFQACLSMFGAAGDLTQEQWDAHITAIHAEMTQHIASIVAQAAREAAGKPP
jgi:hypothetical protein